MNITLTHYWLGLLTVLVCASCGLLGITEDSITYVFIEFLGWLGWSEESAASG